MVKRPEIPLHTVKQPDAPARVGRSRGRRIARGIIVTVVIVALVAGGYVAYNYIRFALGITHVNALVPTKGDLDGKDQNILLVGDDHRPAGASSAELAKLGTTADGGGTSTDSMILLHIPADGQKATLISFPRDSWVAVPGHGMNKLNAAFTLGSQSGGGDSGGAQLLVSTIQNLTGLTINHYVRVSLLGFYNVANALGPVKVCLNHAVKDPYSTVNLPAGVSTLNASQALAFVRQRHGLPNGDLDREIRQQYFLSIEAQKILSAGTLLNPIKLQNVVDAVSSSIETDNNLNLLSLAAQMKGLGSGNITSATIPISGTPTIRVKGRAVSIVQIDTAAMPAFVKKIISSGTTTPPPTTANAVTPARVTVQVQNGRGVSGAAAVATQALKKAGFVTVAPATSIAQSKTTVEYPAGDEAAARLVATYLPGATAVQASDVTRVTVVLGYDRILVTDPAATPTTGTPTGAVAAKTYTAASCIN